MYWPSWIRSILLIGQFFTLGPQAVKDWCYICHLNMCSICCVSISSLCHRIMLLVRLSIHLSVGHSFHIHPTLSHETNTQIEVGAHEAIQPFSLLICSVQSTRDSNLNTLQLIFSEILTQWDTGIQYFGCQDNKFGNVFKIALGQKRWTVNLSSCY